MDALGVNPSTPSDGGAVPPLPIAGPRGAAARLWACTGCRYDLAGLPASGACPECGQAYDVECLWIAGWGSVSEVPYGTPHALRLTLAAVCIVGNAALGSFFLLGGMSRALFLGVVVLLGVPAVMFVLAVAVGERHGVPPLAVSLTPDGVRMKTRLLRDWVSPWSGVRRCRVARAGRGLWRLRIRIGPGPLGLAEFTLVFRGGPRDAALVRRVFRRHGIAARAAPRPSRP